MNKSIRVFISGTHSDLKKERKAVRRVLAHFQIPTVSMETFGSHARPSPEVCERELEKCNLVILIVGHRYGSTIPNSDDLSFTEREFEIACEQGKTVHAYLRRDDVPVLQEHVERRHREKLEEFRKRIRDAPNLTPSHYKDPMDLAIKVAADVSRFVCEQKTTAAERSSIKPARESNVVSANERVVICQLFGRPWPHLGEMLQKAGWQLSFLDQAESIDNRLQEARIVIIPGSGFRRTSQPTDQVAISKLVEFVNRGGRLLCAAQAWSWAEPKYGGKSLDDFPLNMLGRELGFRISNRYTSDPDNSTIDRRLSELRVEIVRRDNQWTASEIESSEPLHSVLLRDSRARPMIIEVCRGAGRVVVAGRETMLEQNPILCDALLRLLNQD